MALSDLFSLVGDCNHTSPVFWFSSVLIGILGCCTVYYVMKRFVSPYFSQYARLSDTDKIDWNNRSFSTIHAIVISVAAKYFLIVSNLFKNDSGDNPILFRSSVSSEFMMGVSMGYFISDLAMIVWFYPMLGGIEYVVHHLLSMFCLAMSMFSGQGIYYIYLILLSETTTPFVNLRWYLSKAGMKKSKLYVVNGISLFIGWMFARVLLYVYFVYHFCQHYDQVKRIFPSGYWCIVLTFPFLTAMNLYWFFKIAKGMIRTLSKRD